MDYFLALGSQFLSSNHSISLCSRACYFHCRHALCHHPSPLPPSPPSPPSPLPLPPFSSSSFSIPLLLESFHTSSPLSHFAPSGTPAKASKRLKQHFRRTSAALAIELHHVLSGLRCAYLYDSGALTVEGAISLVQHLRGGATNTTTPSSSNDLIAVTIDDDAIFFLRRHATLIRLSTMLSAQCSLPHLPVFVDVSSTLQHPQMLLPCHDVEKINELESDIQHLWSSLSWDNDVGGDVGEPEPALIQLDGSRLQHRVAVVGILLEYPVVYVLFEQGQGNCVASDALLLHRVRVKREVVKVVVEEDANEEVTTAKTKTDNKMQHGFEENGDEYNLQLLPWSFTVPQPLVRLFPVRLAVASFFLTIQNRWRRLSNERRNQNDGGKERKKTMLEWRVEEIHATSVCL